MGWVQTCEAYVSLILLILFLSASISYRAHHGDTMDRLVEHGNLHWLWKDMRTKKPDGLSMK